MLGNPSVATVLPNRTPRMLQQAKCANRPPHLDQREVIRRINLDDLGGDEASLT